MNKVLFLKKMNPLVILFLIYYSGVAHELNNFSSNLVTFPKSEERLLFYIFDTCLNSRASETATKSCSMAF